MPVRLNSYLMFNGNAREALDFYQSVFGGEVTTSTFGEYQDSMPVGADDTDKVMHGYLKADNGLELMASDTINGAPFQEGARITLTLNGDDEAVLRGYWDKLAEGGTVTVPLGKSPWDDIFGMLTDRYGINWMIDIGPEQ